MNIFPQGIIQPQLVREIPIGDKPGEIGIAFGNAEIELSSSPNVFFFTSDSKMVVFDGANSRLNYYAIPNLEFISEQKITLPYADRIYSEYGSMWVQQGYFTWELYDKNFNKIQKYNFSSIGQGSTPREGFLWQYIENKKEWECYDRSSKRYQGEEVRKILRSLNKDIYAGKKYSKEIDASIVKMIESEKYPVILNGIFVLGDDNQLLAWYQLFAGTIWQKSKKDLKSTAPFDMSGGRLIQTGPDGTRLYSYLNKPGDYVYYGLVSQYGNLLSYFSYDIINQQFIDIIRKKEGKAPEYRFWEPRIALDWEGNIYFMTIEYNKKVQIYTIKRTW